MSSLSIPSQIDFTSVFLSPEDRGVQAATTRAGSTVARPSNDQDVLYGGVRVNGTLFAPRASRGPPQTPLEEGEGQRLHNSLVQGDSALDTLSILAWDKEEEALAGLIKRTNDMARHPVQHLRVFRHQPMESQGEERFSHETLSVLSPLELTVVAVRAGELISPAVSSSESSPPFDRLATLNVWFLEPYQIRTFLIGSMRPTLRLLRLRPPPPCGRHEPPCPRSKLVLDTLSTIVSHVLRVCEGRAQVEIWCDGGLAEGAWLSEVRSRQAASSAWGIVSVQRLDLEGGNRQRWSWDGKVDFLATLHRP